MRSPKSIFGFQSSLLLAGLLALFGSAVAQTPAPGNQPGERPATNPAPASVAPPASVQTATTNVLPPTSSEIPQKTTPAPVAPPPSWKEIEAAPEYAKLTPAQRKYLFDKWLQQGADSGDRNAQIEIQLEKDAEAGNAIAQFFLGNAFVQGEVFPRVIFFKDQAEGVKWWQKSANQGNVKAQANLSWAYFTGTGVTKDQLESVKWLQKAAEQDDLRSEVLLGGVYFYGVGVKADQAEGVKWLQKAADKGDAASEELLGEAYFDGKGIKKDQSKATEWWLKAAEQGHPRAQSRIGMAYTTGLGIPKNVPEGFKWLLKSAKQGDVDGRIRLAGAYILGNGVIKDEVEGYAWMLLAAAGGNGTAVDMRNREESVLERPLQIAGEQRAKELQAQIASHTLPANDDSATLQSIPPSNMPKASGSGAFISADGLFLTAAHVVQGASRIEVVTAAGTLAATVVKIDATNDVALLKCTGSNFSPVPIAPSKEARAGTSVFTVGFPNIQIQGFDPKLTKGEISSQTGFQDDPRQWQISVPIQPGNSGGPLCDENGNLIGIVEATLDPLIMAKVAGEIPQNVNYAVKSSYILPLLDDVRNLPQPADSANGAKFEDVVGRAQKSVVLILVY